MDKTRDEFVLAISEVGNYTRDLKKLKANEKVRYSQSYGILDKIVKKTQKDIVIIAGGIGITPMISLVKHNLNKDIHLMYSVRKDKEILYKDYLEDFGRRENIKVYTQQTRFTIDDIKACIDGYTDAYYILAGPPVMKQAYTRILKENGVGQESIYCEEFSW